MHTPLWVLQLYTFLAILGQFNWHCGTEHNQQQFWQHQGYMHDHRVRCRALIKMEDGNVVFSFGSNYYNSFLSKLTQIALCNSNLDKSKHLLTSFTH